MFRYDDLINSISHYDLIKILRELIVDIINDNKSLDKNSIDVYL